MKNLKVLMFALLAMSMVFVSCKKEDKTNTALLCNKNGWVLKGAASSPAYALANGTFATDLINQGYLFECEVDDIIKFTENGGQTINPGEKLCEDGYQKEVAATWSFNEDETELTMQIPFFYNDEVTSFDAVQETVQILSLTETELRVKYTFNDDESPAKGTYSFTLTYEPYKK